MTITEIMQHITHEPYFIDTNSAGDVIGVLYCADCLEILPQMPKGCAVISDPPYGKDQPTNWKERGCGNSWAANDYEPIHGDDKEFDPSPCLVFDTVLLFGANYFSSKLPDMDSWIVWDKREGGTSDNQADVELIWTNKGGPARLVSCLWRGMIKKTERDKIKVHPTQKPITLMKWLIGHYTNDGDIILDPFLGSGTTAVAAKRLGRAYIGIEIEERYCAIAKQRLLQMELF